MRRGRGPPATEGWKCRCKPTAAAAAVVNTRLIHVQLTTVQDLNADADVQRLKQRRQNLMYQVAVLQLQRVRAAAAAAAAPAPPLRRCIANSLSSHNAQEKMASMLQTR